MISVLDSRHKKQVLDFCSQREKENLFVIGSFQNYEDPFESNRFYGYFEKEELLGLGVFFQDFGDLVINAPNEKIIRSLVDFFQKENLDIECIAAFKKYADVTINHLQEAYGRIPKTHSKQTVFLLQKKNFHNFSQENVGERASQKDVDDLVFFTTGKKAEEITSADRAKFFFQQEFILRKDGKIISKANTHGVSKNYFQIGGVKTHESYRRQGYARQIVSKLCNHFFEKGVLYGLLFTDNKNIPAKKMYESLGFEPIDDFVIAEY